MYFIIIWIILIIAFVIFEAASTQLISIWFAIAALISLILAMFEVDVWIQIVAFVVSSASLLLLTRPLARRLLKDAPEHTNADRSVGETGIVTEQIDNDAAKGLVKVMGQTWSARSLDGSIIEADTKIKVDSIDGVKLIVEPLVEEKEASNEVKEKPEDTQQEEAQQEDTKEETQQEGE